MERPAVCGGCTPPAAAAACDVTGPGLPSCEAQQQPTPAAARPSTSQPRQDAADDGDLLPGSTPQPATPAAGAAARSAGTPTWAAGAAAAAAAAGGSGRAAVAAPRLTPAQVLSDAGGEAARELRCPALSFVRTVARSRFLRSALLSLELQESHPPVDGACTASTLEWTLAQLLALHLRAGEAEATGNSVAAALWVLESAHDAARSKATACLASWLEYLAVFAPEVVQAMMADWPASSAKLRRVVVEAQMRLLKALDWRLRLDLDTEVWPCLHLLFSLGAPAQQAQQQQRAQQQQQQQDDTADPTTADGGSGDGAPAGLPPPSESWAAGMHAYCANIRLQATLIRQPPAAPEDATGPAALAAAAAGLGLGLSDAPAGSDPFPAAKRQRVAA